jgi:hypothetical protein
VTEQLIGSLEKAADLEIRVRNLAVDGESFVDVREYVPSSDTYGRGLLVPKAQARPLVKILMDAARAD